MTTKVGFVGLGTMGVAMAANAARAGFEVSAWNRTPGRAGDLEGLGVRILDSPAAVAAASDIVITMVSDTPDVDAVLFDKTGTLTEGKMKLIAVEPNVWVKEDEVLALLFTRGTESANPNDKTGIQIRRRYMLVGPRRRVADRDRRPRPHRRRIRRVGPCHGERSRF